LVFSAILPIVDLPSRSAEERLVGDLLLDVLPADARAFDALEPLLFPLFFWLDELVVRPVDLERLLFELPRREALFERDSVAFDCAIARSPCIWKSAEAGPERLLLFCSTPWAGSKRRDPPARKRAAKALEARRPSRSASARVGVCARR
jgi:hypothetical protein